MGRFLNSSVAKKFAMALSGLFLVLFLLQHVIINFTSTISPQVFNNISEFMGHNFFVQAILQPVLIIGIVFHFVMAFVLEYQNNKARPKNYVNFKGNRNSTWMSRNMLWTGLVILAFLGLHFYDFWFPELIHKYVESHPTDASRYYPELVDKFRDTWRVILYVVSFVLLMLHLLHGFYGSFQSIGWNNNYSKGLKGFAKWFSVIVPLLFIYIALFHYINTL